MTQKSEGNGITLPSISVVVPTYNSERLLPQCLKSVTDNDYPKEKIEIIVVDGGSKDKTLEIAKNFGAKIIKERTGRPESATAIGYNYAVNDLILNMPSDNVLPDKQWLMRIVEPFLEHQDVIAVQPISYTYNSTLSQLDRYFAIFGVNDPIAFYLNKQDRLPYAEDKWILKGQAKDYGNFFIVQFDLNCPTLGANGYIVKREIVQKVTKDALKFFHIDSNFDLIKMGYNKFGIAKISVTHLTGEQLLDFFTKRIKYMKVYLTDKSRRRYHLFNASSKEDQKNLLKYTLFSLTFFKTTKDALKGYKKTSDKAALIHPAICTITVFLYGLTAAAQKIRSIM